MFSKIFNKKGIAIEEEIHNQVLNHSLNSFMYEVLDPLLDQLTPLFDEFIKDGKFIEESNKKRIIMSIFNQLSGDYEYIRLKKPFNHLKFSDSAYNKAAANIHYRVYRRFYKKILEDLSIALGLLNAQEIKVEDSIDDFYTYLVLLVQDLTIPDLYHRDALNTLNLHNRASSLE